MKKIILSTLSLLLCFAYGTELRAQKESESRNVVKNERELPVFKTIEIGGTLNVFLEQGDVQKVFVETNDNLQDRVITKVINEKLIIEAQRLKNPGSLRIYITVTELNGLNISGAADVKSQSIIKSEQLKITSLGASDTKLELDVKKLNINASGAATLILKGFANSIDGDISGAADLKADGLLTKVAVIRTSGAASANIQVQDEVNGDVSGASDLKITGDPKIKHITESGTGDISVNEKTYKGIAVKTSGSGDSTRVRLGDIDIEVIDGDTTIVRLGGARLEVDDDGNVKYSNKKKHRFDGHWGGFDIGVNGLVDEDYKRDMPAEYNYLTLNMNKSVNVNINVYEQNFNLWANHFGMITGLGLEYTNYRFNDTINLVKGENGIERKMWDEGQEQPAYIKSKLVVNYLKVPLLFEYQTNRHAKANSFHLTLGVIGGLRIGSHKKTVWQDGGKEKNKVRDDFYLNPFKVEGTARIGWGIVNLYANYSILPLFEENKGPEVYPFSMGLTLGSW